MARLKRLSGSLPTANTLSAKAIVIFAALTKKDPSNHGWRIHYSEALTEQAAELRATRHINAARASVQDALNILEPILAKHPSERSTVLATITARLLLASLADGSSATQTLCKRALQTMQSLKADLGDPRLQALQVQALLALGRHAEAQRLIRQLWKTGYRDLAFVAMLKDAHIGYPVNTAITQQIVAILHPDGAIGLHSATHTTSPSRTPPRTAVHNRQVR